MNMMIQEQAAGRDRSRGRGRGGQLANWQKLAKLAKHPRPARAMRAGASS
eukprot:SAG31_NODE_1717_length_7457_cov_4.893177_3_plen_50_part_00